MSLLVRLILFLLAVTALNAAPQPAAPAAPTGPAPFPGTNPNLSTQQQTPQAAPQLAPLLQVTPARPTQSLLILPSQAELDRPVAVGDRLVYCVAEDRDKPVVVFVNERGEADIPLLGKLEVVGKTLRQLSVDIKELLQRDYYFQATVMLGYHRGDRTRGQVFVLGQAARQGPVEIPADDVLTVSKAILTAGGFGMNADPTRVALIRRDPNTKGETRTEINVAEILDTGKLDKDLVVQSGDLIFVAQKGDTSGTITVTGAVRNPGLIQLPANVQVSVSQAILQAGGFSEFANRRKVKLIRYGTDGQRVEKVIDVSDILDNGNRQDDIRLQPDDMIIVDERWINF